uniref:Hemimethylated DNA-binding domain-containing protein n=1 Tax=Meloidogyne javanica TaxID=6303 RepID=A0A915MET9_MELJA
MVDYLPTLIFLTILFSVPLQFYLSPKSSSDAQYYLHKFVDEIHQIYSKIIGKFFNFSNKKVGEMFEESEQIGDEKEIIGEETISKGEMSGLFGGSDEPRHPRPPHIKYKVGQVVKHKLHNYRGVIVGWDERVKAPDWWIKRVHGTEEIDDPNYTIIIDTRDRLVPQIAYVLERNILLSEGGIVHPLINHYFESFDGKCYKSRPWHKNVYPND